MKRFGIVSIVAMAVALVSFIGLFLPYVCASDEYSKYLDRIGDEKVYSKADLKAKDMKKLSLYEYAKVYVQASDEIFRDSSSGTIYAIVIGAIGLFSLLALLFAVLNKPVWMIINSVLMCAAAYLIHWDFTDRKVMPNKNLYWGIDHYLHYICAGILVVLGIVIIAQKRQRKQL